MTRAVGLSRRVLITGVSRFWGAQLARRLEADASIERIVAVDTQAPGIDLKRTDFIRADIRHGLIERLLEAVEIDTVVHTGLIVDPRRAGARVVHETNVIGTMNLIAACGGASSPVRKLVVKSSTAIYGAEPDDPAIWTEDMRRSAPARDTFTRDLDEVEEYVSDFQVRTPEAVVTLLRFANVLGPEHNTPFARLFDLPAVPTVLGFDPLLQFVHEDDAVSVLERAVLEQHPGVFNVAGGGVVALSQAVSIVGKPGLPLLPFVGTELAVSLLNRLVPIGFPPHLVRLLQYGRVVDTTALCSEFGEVMRHATPAAVAAHARGRRVRGVVAAQRSRHRHETELEEFLRSSRAVATPSARSNGHAGPRREPRRSPQRRRQGG
jgi:UDP-glucose 4-epimerase